jgi:uncharacterized membrane protein YeaQ/YmgE (transglycosylase-associated protein family)
LNRTAAGGCAPPRRPPLRYRVPRRRSDQPWTPRRRPHGRRNRAGKSTTSTRSQRIPRGSGAPRDAPAIIGALARLILPGRQNIPIWLTILVGIVAAFIGTFLARAIGISTATSGIDWLELGVQLVVAVIGVALLAGIYSRRGIRQRARR